jgi:hypothetical protein
MSTSSFPLPWTPHKCLPAQLLEHSCNLLCYKIWTVHLNEVTAAASNHHSITCFLVCNISEALIVPGPISISDSATRPRCLPSILKPSVYTHGLVNLMLKLFGVPIPFWLSSANVTGSWPTTVDSGPFPAGPKSFGRSA